jgi:MFS family permease
MTITDLTSAGHPGPPPGTSEVYRPGPRFRRYKLTYVLAVAGLASVWGGIAGVLLPFQVQDLEVVEVFGPAAQVDLQQLTSLRADVAAGDVVPSPEEAAQLDLLAEYEAGRAANLGIITALSITMSMFMAPLAGALSDRTRSRWGRRAPWIVAGVVLGAALLVAARYSPTIGVLLAIYTLAQVALEIAPGPLHATVPDRVPASRIGRMSGLAGFGSLLGVTVGTVLAGYLFASIGLDAYFPFVLAALVLPMIFVAVARDRSSRGLEVPATTLRKILVSFTIAVRDRDFRWLLIAKAFMWFGYGIATAFAIYMLQSYIQPALSAEEAARTMPLISLVAMPATVLSMFVSGWWSDRIGKRKPIVVGASLAFAASLTLPLLVPTLPAMFVQVIIGGAAIGAFITVDQAYFIDLLPDRDAAARDLGVSSFGQSIGQAAGPAAAGVIVGATGGYQLVWVAAIVAVVLAAVAVLPIRRAG